MKKSTLTIACGSLVLGMLSVAPQVSQAAATTEVVPTISFFISTGQTLDEAMFARAQESSQFRADAIKVIDSWSSAAASGTNLNFSGTEEFDLQSQVSTLGPTRARITGLLGKPEVAQQTQQTSSILVQPASSWDSGAESPNATATPAWGPLDPGNMNSFPVVGRPGSGRLFWQDMKFALARADCGSNGCTVLDKFTVRIRVNPGAKTSMFSITSLYSPYSGDFTKEILGLSAINRGTFMGRGFTGQLNTAKGDVYYASSFEPLNGTVLTSAVSLHVTSKVLGVGVNGAKTADATCDKKPSNVCRYK